MEHDLLSLFSIQISLIETFVRGSAIYLGLFFFLRFCMKRQSSDLGVSDLLVIVLIADAFQNGMSPEQQTISDSFLLAGTILFWAYVLDKLAYHFPHFENLVRPPAVCLIRNGRVIGRNLRSELVSHVELMSQLRLAGIEKVEDVKSCHIEGDGKFSVVGKSSTNKSPDKNIAT